jgi:hypothetical protein
VNLEEFFTDDAPICWGSKVEKEVRRRIKLSVAAYAYEFRDEAIIPDAEFDKMCLEVDPSVNTGNKVMDNFFKTDFNPSTGQWIYRHPELHKIANLYRSYYETD